MFDGDIKREDAIAFFRYTVIEKMLDAPKGEIRKTAIELSKQHFNDVVHRKNVTFSERHLFRFYKAYKIYGLDGLKPKPKSNKGSHPSIPENLVKDILNLKKEIPSRTAVKIIKILEIAEKVDKGVLKPRNVNRLLQKYHYTKEVLSKDTRVYKKHEKEHINQMWLSDVTDGFYIDTGNGNAKMCYLIGFQDDCSRVITHAQFYFDSTLPKLEDSLRKAVMKHGIPEKLYIDNGSIYISNQFKLICAKLGIRLIYSTPYHPAGKGKVEKLWDTIQKSFMTEVKNIKIHSINELNDLFFAWLQDEYHDTKHSSLGITPMERWKLSMQQGQRQLFKSPIEIEEIFLHEAIRKVSKYGVISFQGNTYEIDGKLVGKKITVKYNPFDLSILKIYFDDKYINTAKVIDLSKTKHKDVENVTIETKVDTELSKLYFANLKINYERFLVKQLEEAKQTSNIATSKDEIAHVCEDESNRPALKDKKEAITIDSFYKIVAGSIGEEELSFIEKRRLYELWKDLKDFDPQSLKDFLTELKKSATDYNKNFVYYVEQIKNIYVERKCD